MVLFVYEYVRQREGVVSWQVMVGGLGLEPKARCLGPCSVCWHGGCVACNSSSSAAFGVLHLVSLCSPSVVEPLLVLLT
jgi:hypothetical protein